ncbi:hypothetical protein MKK50_15280 [Methylobacterium sp. J-043]|nr:hypothetical protein [Methylobacterium sp. J-043]
MTSLVETIEAAILENFARESIVILSDGREIITQADPVAVRELAREVEAAILARGGREA